MELFVDRASSVRDDFVPSQAQRVTIETVCTRLDGIPLAIELAAARVRALSVEDIAARLDQRFRLLTGARRTAVERHATLRAAVEWSYDLLSVEDRIALARLSVFVGGFGLTAATAVLGDEAAADAADVVTGLVDKSLINSQHGDGGARFSMLETIRQFAAEKLDASGDADTVRRAHADWVRDFVAEAAQGLRTPDSPRWQAELGRDFDNTRAAVTWCIDVGDAAIAAAIVRPLTPTLLYQSGLEYRVCELADLFPADTGDATILAVVAYAQSHRGELAQTEASCLRARTFLSPSPCRPELEVLYVEAVLQLHQGRPNTYRELTAQRLAVATALDDHYEEANAQAALVHGASFANELATPQSRTRSLELARQIGEPRLLCLALTAEAMHLLMEQSPECGAVVNEALALDTGTYSKAWLSALLLIGSSEPPDTAFVDLTAAMRFLHEAGDPLYTGYTLLFAALVLAKFGRHEPAATLWGRLRNASQFVAGSAMRWIDPHGIDSEDAYADARATGAGMSLEAAVELASQELTQLADGRSDG